MVKNIKGEFQNKSSATFISKESPQDKSWQEIWDLAFIAKFFSRLMFFTVND